MPKEEDQGESSGGCGSSNCGGWDYGSETERMWCKKMVTCMAVLQRDMVRVLERED